jgi:hypothetical protein
MKLLKIEDNIGYYLKTETSTYQPIDKIDKEDLMSLVSSTLEQEVEFDEYDENLIKNQAHQIVYKAIYEQLRSLHNRKDEFKDESERMFLKAYEKYREL